MTPKEYDSFIDLCKNRILFHKLNLDPAELISKIYLYLNDKGEDYDPVKFKNYINKESKTLYYEKLSKIQTYNDALNICSKCSQTLPGNSFRMVYRKKTGLTTQNTICLECETKIFLKHVNKDRNKWNNYLRKRDVKRREELSDSYIRKLLWRKYSTEEMKRMPQIVEGYRKKLIEKRQRKTYFTTTSPVNIAASISHQ